MTSLYEFALSLSEMEKECWNEPSELRRQVLSRLQTILKDRLARDKVPSPFWAFCQVADISKLNKLITIANSIEDGQTLELLLEPTIKDCDSIIDRCKF